jgi:hypothetical protein
MLSENNYREIHFEFEQLIQAAFGGVRFEGGGSTDNHFRSYLSKRNKSYSSTEYFYKKELKFFHLTSLPNLMSIINSRCIRFYDLNSSTDPHEYGYVAKAMGLSTDVVASQKTRLHTFSFCPFDQLNNDHVWKVYGRMYKGVAIIFEIVNDPNDWINFHMAEIKYHLPTSIKKYKSDLIKFETKYGIKATVDAAKLIGFYKKKKYAGEKEVRLLSYSPYSSFQENAKFIKQDYRLARNRNRFTNYFELPLWVDNTNLYANEADIPDLDRRQNLPPDYFHTRPKIRIIDIKLGEQCGLNYDELVELREQIDMTIACNYGYRINLKKEFFLLPT